MGQIELLRFVRSNRFYAVGIMTQAGPWRLASYIHVEGQTQNNIHKLDRKEQNIVVSLISMLLCFMYLNAGT